MLTEQQRTQLDWDKTQGMMPVIVQHHVSGEVLMHGYMNPAAWKRPWLRATSPFSPAPKPVMDKGETSGNFLQVITITPDCDNDTLLVLANPIWPDLPPRDHQLLFSGCA